MTHVESEKKILSSVSHPFIINLVSSSLDTRFLYFVLPFIPGGELFSHLRAVRRFRKVYIQMHHINENYIINSESSFTETFTLYLAIAHNLSQIIGH